MIAIVVSRADSASEHLGEQLLALGDWEAREDDAPDAAGGGAYYRLDDGEEAFELRTFDGLHIYLEDPAPAFSETPRLLAFVSRHSGDTGPLLSAHFTGNFGPAEYGGAPGAFACACPNAQAAVVASLAAYAPEAYDVGIECTHHGPTDVAVPSMFVELGSDESAWADPEGARAVARAVLDLRGVAATADRTLVGFGGNHYAPRFHRVLRDTDWTVGHVASDWQLEAMGDPAANRETLAAAFEASDATHALVEGDRPALEVTLADLGYRVVSETWVRETDGVPLPLVASLEADLVPVEAGLRLGDAARRDATGAAETTRPGAAADAPDYEVASLPDELLAEAFGIDGDATRAAVREAAVAFETAEGGTRPVGRAALPTDGGGSAAYDAVVDALAAVLRERYGTVTRRDDELVATRTAFDPAAARELGVPEGPAFGELSAGRSVTVDGEEVRPEMVHRERTVRFSV